MNSENTSNLNINEIKGHKSYQNEYEIIENREQFSKYFGNKYKVAWLNNKGKLCLRSYILIAPDRDNKENFVSVDVIDGKSQEKTPDNIKHYSDIFKSENLVFVGYLSNEKIFKHLTKEEPIY